MCFSFPPSLTMMHDAFMQHTKHVLDSPALKYALDETKETALDERKEDETRTEKQW